MLVDVNDAVYNRFSTICDTIGENPKDKLSELMEMFSGRYCDENGKFIPKKAILYGYPNTLGKRVEMGECLVLNKITVFGVKYYSIFHDGMLLKVPIESVDFVDK